MIFFNSVAAVIRYLFCSVVSNTGGKLKHYITADLFYRRWLVYLPTSLTPATPGLQCKFFFCRWFSPRYQRHRWTVCRLCCCHKWPVSRLCRCHRWPVCRLCRCHRWPVCRLCRCHRCPVCQRVTRGCRPVLLLTPYNEAAYLHESLI